MSIVVRRGPSMAVNTISAFVDVVLPHRSGMPFVPHSMSSGVPNGAERCQIENILLKYSIIIELRLVARGRK